MTRYVAFVDESGDANVANTDSNYFVLAAVVMPETDVEKATQYLEELAQSEYGGSEIKAKSIGGKHTRRANLLAKLNDGGLRAMAVVFDTGLLRSSGRLVDSGLRFKRSFYKYATSRLYTKLFERFQDLRIVADELGTEEFKASLLDYHHNKLVQQALFGPKIELVSSLDCRAVQAADLVAGSTRRAYQYAATPDWLAPLQSVLSYGSESWPAKGRDSFFLVAPGTSHDLAVRKLSEQSATKWLLQHDEGVRRHGWNVVQQLVQRLRLGAGPVKYHVLADIVGVSKELVQRTVVRDLRNDGVLIAGLDRGVCLPESASQLFEHFRRQRTVIEPMLARVHPVIQKMEGHGIPVFELCHDAAYLSKLAHASASAGLAEAAAEET